MIGPRSDDTFSNPIEDPSMIRGIAQPHPGDLRPRQIGLSGEEFCRKRLHCLANLDKPHANGVEHEPIA